MQSCPMQIISIGANHFVYPEHTGRRFTEPCHYIYIEPHGSPTPSHQRGITERSAPTPHRIIKLYDYAKLQANILRQARLREVISTCTTHTHQAGVERDAIFIDFSGATWHRHLVAARDALKRHIIVDTPSRRHRRHFIAKVFINMVFITITARD